MDALVRQRDRRRYRRTYCIGLLKRTSTLQMLSHRHTKEAASYIFFISCRHIAALEKPKMKKFVTSSDNCPSMASQAHSYKRLRIRLADITVERPVLWQANPYMDNISKAVAHLLNPYGVRVAHRPAGTLHSRLTIIKD